MFAWLARPRNLPTVLTRKEVGRLLNQRKGKHALMARLLYGCGLRIFECLRLRVQDVDLSMKAVTVRSGKGAKDRVTTFPKTIIPTFEEHLKRVRLLHEQDSKQGYGKVYLPFALSRKYPNAAGMWQWQ